jgi:hypothetical protein
MKKLLSFLVVMSILVGVVGVMADDQDVDVTVQNTVDFSLDTASLNYGAIPSGGESLVKGTDVTIGTNNNVNLILTIMLTEDTDNIFSGNIYYDLDDLDTYPDQLVLDIGITTNLLDEPADATRTDTLNSKMMIPAGTSSITATTGTVVFTATANPPI